MCSTLKIHVTGEQFENNSRRVSITVAEWESIKIHAYTYIRKYPLLYIRCMVSSKKFRYMEQIYRAFSTYVSCSSISCATSIKYEIRNFLDKTFVTP